MPDARSLAGPVTRHRLEARLLGGLSLRYDGQPLPETAFRRRKSLILLLRLLTNPGHRLAADAALEMLWPGEDPQAGAVNLRAVLSAIRAALPDPTAPNPVLRLDTALAIDPALDMVLDLDQFEANAAAGLAAGDPAALQRAMTLYAGPLLPGLPYEDWALERGASLARRHRQVVLALAAEGEAAAEERLRALLAEDATDEQAAQALMRLLGGHGRRAEALRIHHALVTALEEELGVEPSPETAALHAVLLEPPAPQPLDQVAAPTPAHAPPVAARHNLPASFSSFVGRAWERAELRQLLERTRLLTLVGPGGAGKTRLALAVAEEWLAAFPDAVWLVELAAIGTGSMVIPAVAQALGLREQQGRPPLDALTAHLATGPALLLLDNCEQVLDACAELADRLLRACPSLRIMATSRERLGLTGELVWRIPPLSLPPEDPDLSQGGVPLARLAQAEAVQLFVERVRGARPGFALGVDNASAVARICRRLDGIPLALELAAARAGSLGVEQIARRLDDRFRLLTGGSRAALPRQQALRASIDWSYELLSGGERALLGRLSVFAGSWTLEAAEAVCAGAGTLTTEAQRHGDGAEVLDLLDGLAAKSLVQVEEADGGEARYRMLETVRQYAEERLGESGEAAATRTRHLDWCRALAEEASPHLTGAAQATWLLRLEAEHNNLREALRHATSSSGDPAGALALAGALWRFWKIRGHWTEGRRWLEAALERGAGAPPALRARALIGAGALASDQGDDARAVALFEESLALYRERGDTEGIAASLNNLGTVMMVQGEDARAGALFEESLAIMRELGDSHGVASALSNLARIAWRQGDLRRAVALLEEGLALDRRRGDRAGIAISLSNLGILARQLGDYARAAALQEESLAIKRDLGHRRGIAASLENLGGLARVLGDYPRAASLLEESLAIMRELGDSHGVATALNNLGGVAGDQGEYRRAEALLEESVAGMRRLGNRRGIAQALRDLGNLAAEQGQLERAGPLLEESLALFSALGDRPGIAGALNSLGSLAGDRGDLAEAARLLHEARSCWNALGDTVGSAEVCAALGGLAHAEGDDALALALYTESLALLRRIPARRGIALCLEGVAQAAASGHAEQAAHLLGAAESLRSAIGAPLPPRDRAAHERAVGTVLDALGEAAFAAACAAGRSLGMEDAIELACALTAVPTHQGQRGPRGSIGAAPAAETAGQHQAPGLQRP